MNRIIIGFSTHKKWAPFPEIIKAIEKTNYSHVYCKLYIAEADRWVIYHATGRGLNFMNLDTFSEVNETISEFSINITPEQQVAIHQYCIDRAGWDYGKLEIFGMAYCRIARAWFDLDVNNPLGDSKTMVCSELVGNILSIIESPIPNNLLESQGPRFIHERLEDLSSSGIAEQIH